MKPRRFSAQNTPKSHTNQLKHSQNLTDTRLIATVYQNSTFSIQPHIPTLLVAVSLNPQTLQQHLLALVQEQSAPAFAKLLQLLKGWFAQKWKELRMSVSSRLTKLKYLLPSLVGEGFGRSEKEILQEWRKNALLHGLVYLWVHVCGVWKFGDIEEIKTFYNAMRAIISQLSYLLFEPCLKSLLKEHAQLESRLFDYTAVEIITRDKDWPRVVERVIKPHYQRETVCFSQNYNLQDLQARPQILDLQSHTPLFQQTALSLKNLIQSSSRDDIFKNLKQYRASLLKEIEANIDQWRKRKNPKKQITVEKEDILACIIYCLVRYKLDDIAQTLKYIAFLWGKEIQNVLGAQQVDSYRVDLQVAYGYLSEPVVQIELPSLEKLEVLS